ncbi:hypothetical protein ACLOJK_017080 [Asimina triloba]
MTTDGMSNASSWSREQEKAFENAIATHPEDCSDRWEKIAADVPGKTVAEIKHHYELLVEDINGIESGRVPLPSYVSSSEGSTDHASEGGASKKGTHVSHFHGDSNHSGKASKPDQERRKGVAWTEDEHSIPAIRSASSPIVDFQYIHLNSVANLDPLRQMPGRRPRSLDSSGMGFEVASNMSPCHADLSMPKSGNTVKQNLQKERYFDFMVLNGRLFLLGLEKYGKGDWRSISRNFVVSRTPTQVASHAQKYFIRLNSMNKDRRRSSIHDITSVGNGDISVPQGPITGLSNGSSGGPGKSVKQSSQPPPGAPVGVYGTPTIGQPIGGPLVSAVGTPVNLPAPSHMAYGIRAPIAGAVVPGAPMNMAPMTYPMPHTGHR